MPWGSPSLATEIKGPSPSLKPPLSITSLSNSDKATRILSTLPWSLACRSFVLTKHSPPHPMLLPGYSVRLIVLSSELLTTLRWLHVLTLPLLSVAWQPFLTVIDLNTGMLRSVLSATLKGPGCLRFALAVLTPFVLSGFLIRTMRTALPLAVLSVVFVSRLALA